MYFFRWLHKIKNIKRNIKITLKKYFRVLYFISFQDSQHDSKQCNLERTCYSFVCR